MGKTARYIISAFVIIVGIAVLLEGKSYDDSVLKTMGIICIIIAIINGFVAAAMPNKSE